VRGQLTARSDDRHFQRRDVVRTHDVAKMLGPESRELIDEEPFSSFREHRVRVEDRSGAVVR
jgi:hypothetical protein